MNNSRWVFLDCETTGLEYSGGDRVIEVACVEVVRRKFTGREFHSLFNPERRIPMEAQRIHGISDEDVAEAPRFREKVQELVAFLSDSEVIAHNAPFDVNFLNKELSLVDHVPMNSFCQITDSLKLANELYRGKSNSLDALCDRLGVDRSQRLAHGAMIDTKLLAQIYLIMTQGQEPLNLELRMPEVRWEYDETAVKGEDLVLLCTSEEEAAHLAYMASLTPRKSADT